MAVSGSDHSLQQWLLDRRRRSVEADRRHPWRRDMIVIQFLLAFTLPGALNSGDHGPAASLREEGWPTAVILLAALALVVPLWWRRRKPLVAFGGVSAVLLAEWLVGLQIPTATALLVALCGVAIHASWRALIWAVGITTAQMTVAVYVFFRGGSAEVNATLLFLLLGTATAAVAIGLTVRTRAAYLQALEDRAARLETERDQRARLAAAGERARIAREMHDIVGHHVSIIVGLADGGAALAASRDERAEEPLRLIGDTGRQALGELRRVLGVLKEGSESQLSPQPDLAELDRLVAGVRAAGLAVTCRTEGDLHRLGPGMQLAVYRIVQEALTNTLKHAGSDAAAEVSVEADEAGEVRVRIRDHGPSRPGGHPPAHGDWENHQGVLGIRERAGLYGGTVTAGPAAGDGWLVDVVMREPA